MKTCSKCKIEKSLKEYNRFFRKDRQKFYTYCYCKICAVESTKKWQKKNPDRTKIIKNRSRIKVTYGITEEQYREQIDRQKNKCAICGNKESYTKLVIDHNHVTGKVRKLLCHNCNKVLGLIKENKKTLRQMINYLEKE